MTKRVFDDQRSQHWTRFHFSHPQTSLLSLFLGGFRKTQNDIEQNHPIQALNVGSVPRKDFARNSKHCPVKLAETAPHLHGLTSTHTHKKDKTSPKLGSLVL